MYLLRRVYSHIADAPNNVCHEPIGEKRTLYHFALHFVLRRFPEVF